MNKHVFNLIQIKRKLFINLLPIKFCRQFLVHKYLHSLKLFQVLFLNPFLPVGIKTPVIAINNIAAPKISEYQIQKLLVVLCKYIVCPIKGTFLLYSSAPTPVFTSVSKIAFPLKYTRNIPFLIRCPSYFSFKFLVERIVLTKDVS